ncbi:MAG: chemotaxis protein CheD [Deltaproteobacteria bacterium]|nr:MAG: chemotaxis protein CheD [Deltaproteobacteria bacterium]
MDELKFPEIEIIKTLVFEGEVKISEKDILEANVSTCVSVCLYHPGHKIGGMCHITRSREHDVTPSEEYLKTGGYYYADEAMPRLLELLRERCPSIIEGNLESVLAGGRDNAGLITETYNELRKYGFRSIRLDVDQDLFRDVSLNPVSGIVTIIKYIPYSRTTPFLSSKPEEKKEICLLDINPQNL